MVVNGMEKYGERGRMISKCYRSKYLKMENESSSSED
jgi:hypothetical protein